MKLTIEITCDNDAFGEDPGPELARILTRLANDAKCGKVESYQISDVNGNAVGKVKVTE